jgi:hypothetical protein
MNILFLMTIKRTVLYFTTFNTIYHYHHKRLFMEKSATRVISLQPYAKTSTEITEQ